LRRDLFEYELPEGLVAVRPLAERDGARLLVVGPPLQHQRVSELARLTAAGSLLIINDTRVVPARLLGQKRGSGGKVEVFLTERQGEEQVELDGRTHSAERWRALGRSSKPFREGAIVDFDERGQLACRVAMGVRGEGGTLEVSLFSPAGVPLADAIAATGHVPLPPYLRREDDDSDRERYQTIFADKPGAVAAPTAGLHLTERLVTELATSGVAIAKVTLHVGLGTFQPVTVEDLDDHPMHSERFEIPEATAVAIAETRARGGKVLAVGTTVVRALESAACPSRRGHVLPIAGETRLLIQPGYDFRVVDALMTNFHLPGSTLLALVSAFGGSAEVRAAYQAAIAERYRFYSYGDAMLLERPSQR
jgi:S-adenosylmethionine:tRNA ribosyltransferase-isomerase